MKKLKVLGIAPYDGIKNLMNTISADYPQLDFSVELADMEEAVSVIKRHRETDYDVVMTRGKTAEILKEISIPVVEIEISVFDILDTFKLAGDYNHKIALVSLADLAAKAQQLSSLIGYNIDIFTINDSSSVSTTLKEVHSMGYDALICDNMTYRTALYLGINSYIITSGADSVRKAFDQCSFLSQYNLSRSNRESSVNGIKKMDYVEIERNCSDSIYGSIGLTGMYNEEIRRINAINSSVLICGEPGTGKEYLSYIIYSRSVLVSNPLYKINFDLIGKKDFSDLISNSSSPLYGKDTTIVFCHINSLTKTQCSALIDAILQLNTHNNNRLIVTSSSVNGKAPANALLFKESLGCTTLFTKTLTCLSSKIPSFASMLLSKMNSSLPQRVFLIEPAAVELLKNHPWPHNFPQFENVMKNLVMSTVGNRIMEENVISILENEPSTSQYQSNGLIYDNTKTLYEMEKIIAEMSVFYHNGNHSEAAKSLGISRTTLWRLLK